MDLVLGLNNNYLQETITSPYSDKILSKKKSHSVSEKELREVINVDEE